MIPVMLWFGLALQSLVAPGAEVVRVATGFRFTEGPAPDAQFKELLIDGPRLGVFVIAWCDTVGSLTRALDRGSIAEFGNRVLMQMSANDSSMLIESTSASRLGLHRAIFFDEERGAEEKFRPYGLPEPAFVKQLAADLAS